MSHEARVAGAIGTLMATDRAAAELAGEVAEHLAAGLYLLDKLARLGQKYRDVEAAVYGKKESEATDDEQEAARRAGLARNAVAELQRAIHVNGQGMFFPRKGCR